MTNSLLLRVAVGLCLMNSLCALWSAWTTTSLRGRLLSAEEAIVGNADRIGTLGGALNAEGNARAKALDVLSKRLEALEGWRKQLEAAEKKSEGK